MNAYVDKVRTYADELAMLHWGEMLECSGRVQFNDFKKANDFALRLFWRGDIANVEISKVKYARTWIVEFWLHAQAPVLH